MTEYE
jgi:phosphoglycerate dehydrogenase-like enzyme